MYAHRSTIRHHVIPKKIMKNVVYTHHIVLHTMQVIVTKITARAMTVLQAATPLPMISHHEMDCTIMAPEFRATDMSTSFSKLIR